MSEIDVQGATGVGVKPRGMKAVAGDAGGEDAARESRQRHPGPRNDERGGVRVSDFLEVTRVDHWFKNVFVVVGWLAALLYFHRTVSGSAIAIGAVTVAAACFISTINYIVNAIADAPFDAHHPVKSRRALPAGRVRSSQLVLWLVGFAAGVGVCMIVLPAGSALGLAALLVAGLVYNIPPVRAKDIPYVDVISESINNPIRILIGWHVFSGASAQPPVVLLLLTWVFGAYLMTAKRFAELRSLKALAAAYRPTFKRYSSRSLGLAMMSYAAGSVVLYVIVAIDTRAQMLWALPLIIVFLVWLTRIAFEEDSMVKEPERLFRKPLFFAYSLVTFVVLVGLAAL